MSTFEAGVAYAAGVARLCADTVEKHPWGKERAAALRAFADGIVEPEPSKTAPPAAVAPADPAPPGGPGKERETARALGYTGDSCQDCGSMKMVRNGTCLKCDECGSTSGCS